VSYTVKERSSWSKYAATSVCRFYDTHDGIGGGLGLDLAGRHSHEWRPVLL
jgi:hypothetical protein